MFIWTFFLIVWCRFIFRRIPFLRESPCTQFVVKKRIQSVSFLLVNTVSNTLIFFSNFSAFLHFQKVRKKKTEEEGERRLTMDISECPKHTIMTKEHIFNILYHSVKDFILQENILSQCTYIISEESSSRENMKLISKLYRNKNWFKRSFGCLTECKESVNEKDKTADKVKNNYIKYGHCCTQMS